MTSTTYIQECDNEIPLHLCIKKPKTPNVIAQLFRVWKILVVYLYSVTQLFFPLLNCCRGVPHIYSFSVCSCCSFIFFAHWYLCSGSIGLSKFSPNVCHVGFHVCCPSRIAFACSANIFIAFSGFFSLKKSCCISSYSSSDFFVLKNELWPHLCNVSIYDLLL